MGFRGVNAVCPNSLHLVKIYLLNDGKWDDKGTGHATVDYLARSEDLALFVIDDEDSELLLLHRISSDDIYQRLEDKIISWRDRELSTELAPSFQEAIGCSYIWDHFCSVQRNRQFRALGKHVNMTTDAAHFHIELDSFARSLDIVSVKNVTTFCR